MRSRVRAPCLGSKRAGVDVKSPKVLDGGVRMVRGPQGARGRQRQEVKEAVKGLGLANEGLTT